MIQSSYHKRSIRKSLLVICGVLVFLIGSWLLLDYGKWRLIYQEMAEAIAQKPLISTDNQDAVHESADELSDLRQQVTILERAAQVDKIEQDEIRKLITELEVEKQELQEELAFYKNVLFSTKDSKGLQLQAFRLESLNDKQRYRYELFLTRIAKGGRVTSGEITITLHGNNISGSAEYNLADLNDQGLDLAFKIKHFKRLSGVFSLPEGFKPETVKIVIKPVEAETKPIEIFYQWVEIMS